MSQRGGPRLEPGAPGTSTLVLAPTRGEAEAAVHRAFRESVEGDDTVVEFSYLRSPGRVRAGWAKRTGTPYRHVIIDGRPGPRSGVSAHAGTTPVVREDEWGHYAVASAEPTDLTGLSIAWNQALNATADGDLFVRFDSLTTLLQYAPASKVARFVRALTTAVDRHGARAQLLLDPVAYDEATVAAIRTAVDRTRDLTAVEDDALGEVPEMGGSFADEAGVAPLASGTSPD